MLELSMHVRLGSESITLSTETYQVFPVVNGIGMPQSIYKSSNIADVPLDSRARVLDLRHRTRKVVGHDETH